MIGRSVVVNVKMDFVQSSGGGETTLAQAYRYLGPTRTTCNLLCEFCQRR